MTSRLPSRMLAATLALAACGAQAAVFDIVSSQEGSFWSPDGHSTQSGPSAGTIGIHEVQAPSPVGGTYWGRAYLIFDLTPLRTLTDPIRSATLRIKVASYTSTGPGTFHNGKWSTRSNASEPFSVVHATAPLDKLTGNYGGPPGQVDPMGLIIWGGLAGGTPWGSFQASEAVVGQFVDVQLTPAAVDALNQARGSKIAVGLNFTGTFFDRLGGKNGAPLVTQQITIDTKDDGHRLILRTPPVEPGH